MDLLSTFLERFKNLKDPRKDRIEIAKILSEAFSVDFADTDVAIKKGIVSLKAPLIVKNQLFMRKEEVLSKLQTALPKLFITDIR